MPVHLSSSCRLGQTVLFGVPAKKVCVMHAANFFLDNIPLRNGQFDAGGHRALYLVGTVNVKALAELLQTTCEDKKGHSAGLESAKFFYRVR